MKFMVINGPNLDMLGIREVNIYGGDTYANLIEMITSYAEEKNVSIVPFQSNIEGEIVNAIHSAYFDGFDGIIINPAAYTHYSIAILDAIKAVNLPCVEVHISNINSRDEFRKISYTSQGCIGIIAGFGFFGYKMALDALLNHIQKNSWHWKDLSMNNIYLIGMPGCGKTTLGKEVSKEFKLCFIDLDLYLAEKENCSIEEIFSKKGEEYFRKRETYYLNEVSKNKKFIVSTGGGIVLFDENIKTMKDTGFVIFIDTPPDIILNNSTLSGRPLLKDKNKIFALYEERYEKYKKASDFIVENLSDIKTAKDKICNILKLKIIENTKNWGN